MRRNRMPLRMICLFLLLIELLASNAFAVPGFGTLELQVVAGKPAIFTDPSLTGGKYRASFASVSIYPIIPEFSYNGSTDKEGKIIVPDLRVGLAKYEISFIDHNEGLWKGEGSVFIKSDSWEKKFVELKKET